jgi:GNAT superfamily N-acetyltransferase
MGGPISVRLDDKLRQTLEEEAQARGVGLSAYLRQLAEAEARRLERERIRAQTEAVGAYVAANPEARQFYEDWGTPTAEGV